MQEELVVAQLASTLAYFFISLKFPVPPFLSSVYRVLYYTLSDTSLHMHLHSYVLPYHLIPSLASNVLCRLALILEIEPVTETDLHAHRKDRSVLGAARGGHVVACATEM